MGLYCFGPCFTEWLGLFIPILLIFGFMKRQRIVQSGYIRVQLCNSRGRSVSILCPFISVTRCPMECIRPGCQVQCPSRQCPLEQSAVSLPRPSHCDVTLIARIRPTSKHQILSQMPSLYSSQGAVTWLLYSVQIPVYSTVAHCHVIQCPGPPQVQS